MLLFACGWPVNAAVMRWSGISYRVLVGQRAEE
jgi:hypothetical protein